MGVYRLEGNIPADIDSISIFHSPSHKIPLSWFFSGQALSAHPGILFAFHAANIIIRHCS